MKRIQYVLLGTMTLFLGSCNNKEVSETLKPRLIQAYQEHGPVAHHFTALEVLTASKEWIAAFNTGSGEDCGNGYDASAVMQAMPFGKKQGKKEITSFWTSLKESGASNLVYSQVGIEVVDEKTAFLSANWQMNIGRGVIYHEKWEKKETGWVMTYDGFEVLEQFEVPLANAVNPIASHIVLEEVVKTSIDWVNAFNSQKGEQCGEGYLKEATMNAEPFLRAQGIGEITEFWKKLISDGAKNLIYHNPSFKQVAPDRVLLSSDWSMNIGEGKIYQENWVKEQKKWVFGYDEFQVSKQYQ